MSESNGEFQVVEFGPLRGIGLAMQVKDDAGDFGGLWQQQLFPRAGEVVRPAQAGAMGVYRCVPGATDGTFEYLALLEATADAPVPAGMLALNLPRTHYAVFPVAGLAALGAAWARTSALLEAQKVWLPYCGRQGCRCAECPAFEYHAWDSRTTGKVLIYVPVYRA